MPSFLKKYAFSLDNYYLESYNNLVSIAMRWRSSVGRAADL
ncbi:protein of unknown function [Ruminococcaceae bacterium BL-4]|nr:protein of unknown function [Ruminococcaceae bacterium BL-4]